MSDIRRGLDRRAPEPEAGLTLVVGVDAGATRSRAVVLDDLDREVGRAEGPAAALGTSAPALVAGAVASIVRAALEPSGPTASRAGALWAGLAGASDEEGRSSVQAALFDAGLADAVCVGTDAEAAFFDVFGGGPGILLIAGTGSIAWARAEAGDVIRVGGWGARLGDQGSAYAIGLAALRAVARAEDGRGPQTRLQGVLRDRLAVSGAGLVAWSARATKGDVAALAPLVARAADDGDAAAERILDTAADELAEHVDAALARTAPWTDRAPVALAGGVLATPGRLRDRLLRRLGDRAGVELLDVAVDAARGAARLARTLGRPSGG